MNTFAIQIPYLPILCFVKLRSDPIKSNWYIHGAPHQRIVITIGLQWMSLIVSEVHLCESVVFANQRITLGAMMCMRYAL